MFRHVPAGVETPSHLHGSSSQTEDTPCHSFRGGTGSESGEGQELYVARNLSNISRAPAKSSPARAVNSVCAPWFLCLKPRNGERHDGRDVTSPLDAGSATHVPVTGSHQRHISPPASSGFRNTSNRVGPRQGDESMCSNQWPL